MDLRVQNKLEPKKGRFLLAEPFLQESHFHRSVIFLCEHNEEGTFGFVLNKFLEVIPTELTEQFPGKNLTVCVGGPVDEGNLFYIHKSPDLVENSYEIGKDLYMGGDYDRIKELVNSGIIEENEVLFFLGYSGWSPKQLEEEIEGHSWLVAETDNPSQHIFSFDENLWKTLMSEQDKRHKMMTNFPENPMWN